LGRPGYAPPLRAADLSSKVAVVWRKPEQGSLPAEAEPEFAKIAGNAAATPERFMHPLAALSYPSTSAEQVWEWMVVVADPARR
jgi:hypothetical protein